MSWKIKRIEISSFKAFKRIELELGNSSLITLDGPNGYGKTSIYDALELLLTGQIKRIENLFSTIMIASKKNYDDSLFWNARSYKEDLLIKVEFIDGDRILVLARHVPTETLQIKNTNRADQFNHFTLYELPEFESEDYTENNKRNNDFLDEVFGKNFRENFLFLNYLEQGQNKLLYSRVDIRKNALNNLFNISDVKKEIENCIKIERKLTSFISNKERKLKEELLENEIANLRGMIQEDIGQTAYKKLSNGIPEPVWDMENPFPVYDAKIHAQYLNLLGNLSELLSKKSAIRIKIHNESIESNIKQHAESLFSIAKLGVDVSKLDQLNAVRKEIDLLTQAMSIIKKGALYITIEQAGLLPILAGDELKLFKEQIAIRDSLQAQVKADTSAASELSRLKKQLLKEHLTLYPDDEVCPLCGCNWQSHAFMLEAIEKRTQKINEELTEGDNRLSNIISLMTIRLTKIQTQILQHEEKLKPKYNDALYGALMAVNSRLTVIQDLGKWLKTEGIPINYTFSDDEAIVAMRLEELKKLMRAKKHTETVELTEGWRQIIDEAFKDVQDFYILDPQDLINKEIYIKIKAREAQSSRLKQCDDDLKKIHLENEAANKAKIKVKNLREIIMYTEQRYTDLTISGIELVFHIYSGRLIQNYQRGLGLFIESEDGKQLRFLTAEKSDHDAIMSMSTGQTSALSLAFFLSLNKVYAKIPLILIDDPFQSLDEVNIASLTDLLRCDLGHRQLIVSSHEEDISAYMRYRFDRAGLMTTSLNMQRLTKEN